MHVIPFAYKKPEKSYSVLAQVEQRKKSIWLKKYLNSHFAPAFYFLAPHRRKALKLLYAICRLLDDAVDKPQHQPEEILWAWRNVFEKFDATFVERYGQKELASDFLLVIKKFDIPIFSLLDLIEKGVAVDLYQSRFRTAMDLESYGYGVASTVGLACLPIFGVPWQEAKDFAIRLGITVQWINAIRDVGTDALMGRIYIPLDHMTRFGYTEMDLIKKNMNQSFYDLMNFESAIARSNYQRTLDLLPPRWEQELLPARIMGKIYMRLLAKIERCKFQVFDQKIRLNIGEKALATWQTLRE